MLPPPAGTVEPERILKDLRKLWVDLGKQNEQGVLRACAMTFIAAVAENDEATHVSETIAALMHEHPSRAILVRVRETDELFVEAHVLAQCWMPFGKAQQICCEQIEITASRRSLADVAPVISGLTVPDLPVVLFCPNADLCQSSEFQTLTALADKLIIDSGSASDLTTLKFLASLPRTGLRTADLAWGRLTRWRETIGRLFEKPAQLSKAYNLTNIQILYAGSDEPVAVYYLAGWFMHILGAGVHLNIARGVGPSYSSIARIDLVGPDLEATLDLVEPTAVELRSEGLNQHVVFPELTDYDVLRKELAITGRDPIFEDVLGLANLMGGFV
jgi:glucose-6-phosphate dehydrogenase assembly protein OpcA